MMKIFLFLKNFQSSTDADFYPVHLPDDVPVDFLEGRMDLKVVLPSEKTVRMSVERRYYYYYYYIFHF